MNWIVCSFVQRKGFLIQYRNSVTDNNVSFEERASEARFPFPASPFASFQHLTACIKIRSDGSIHRTTNKYYMNLSCVGFWPLSLLSFSVHFHGVWCFLPISSRVVVREVFINLKRVLQVYISSSSLVSWMKSNQETFPKSYKHLRCDFWAGSDMARPGIWTAASAARVESYPKHVDSVVSADLYSRER